jgi:hypothetical protein
MYVENSIDTLMLDNLSAFDGYRSSRGNFVGQLPTAFGYWFNQATQLLRPKRERRFEF